ncbi:MAG: uL15 family ribosomal protein [Patescibacteria group bacterium]|nr:uL15 family ribosomal protein [Patescibacteria group bacterium]MDE1945837.1 uL15 family ribosomal protein [Patescibacteria group bacterium]
MKIHELVRKTPNKKYPMIGRGGKRGKTSGRGGKGQTARAGHKGRPEMRDIIKRMPKLRGRGKNSNVAFRAKPAVVNLVALDAVFSAGDAVTPAILAGKGLVRVRGGQMPSVKILGTGDITKKLSVTGCLASAEAKAKIEKAGGSVK